MGHFELLEGKSPLILSFPHSGTDIPRDIAQNLTPEGLRMTDTDWYVPRLYHFARAMDVTWLEAKISRSVIDLNRDPDGASLYPGQNTTALCPVDNFDGVALWQDGAAPDTFEIARRKQLFFTPYHDILTAQIARIKARHGFAVLYDCHSIRGTVPRLFAGDLPALNLGTFQGKSCASDVQGTIAKAMQESPFSHVINGRFCGGWITRHYGRPGENIHTVQMEIAQSTYMHETPPWEWQTDRALKLQVTLENVLGAVLAWAAARA